MRTLLFAFAGVLVATTGAIQGASTSAKEELRQKLEQDIAEFCREVHNAEPLILPRYFEAQPGSDPVHPDLTFKYANIRCEGVEKPALKQCGYCGLTMEGMVCAVKTFTFENGRYVEKSSRVEPLLQ